MPTFDELTVFTRVVDAGSFTLAARSLGLTPSGVSRVVARLEARLGVRLLQRTTRRLSVTDDGARFCARCKSILFDLEDAEAAITNRAGRPSGRLRVDAPTSLVRYVIGPALPKFLGAYPELALDLSVRDHMIDPVGEGMDVTLRVAPLRESELVSKTVGAMRMTVAGSPRYFAKHGRPKHPDDLAKHQLIGFLAGGATLPWRFREDRELAIAARLQTNSGDAHREAALAGLGLINVFTVHIAKELASGKLEAVLVDHERAPRPIYALYAKQRASVPKVRLFLDWMRELLADADRH